MSAAEPPRPQRSPVPEAAATRNAKRAALVGLLQPLRSLPVHPTAPTVSTSSPAASGARTIASVLAPNALGVKHWSRLLGGLLYAATSRVDWARLLRRSFDADVLQRPTCGGRLRMLGEVTDAPMVRLVLESLALPADAPRAARAR